MDHAAAAAQRTRWDIVLLGFACGVVGMFQTAKMSIALAGVQADIGLGLVAASWSLTAVSLSGAVFGIQAGRISEEFGVVRTLVFALLLSAAAAVALALVADPALFVAARVVEGVGYLLVCAAAPAMMAAFATPRDRGLALALWGAFVPVSVSLMSIAGPPVIVAYGWRALFLASAATAALAAAAVALAVPSTGPGARSGEGRIGAVLRAVPRDMSALYTSVPSLGIGVAFLAFAALQVGFIALEPTFLIDHRGMDIGTVGLVLSVTTPFALVGTGIAGLLIRAGAGEAAMSLSGFAGMAASGAAVFLAPADAAVMIALGAAFFTAGGVVASVIFAGLPARATAAATVPLLSGLIVQFGNIGVLVGAPMFAAVAETFAWETVPLAFVALAALGAAGILAGRR